MMLIRRFGEKNEQMNFGKDQELSDFKAQQQWFLYKIFMQMKNCKDVFDNIRERKKQFFLHIA